MSLRTATKYYATTFYHYNLVQSNVSCLRSTIQRYDTMAHYRPYRECYGLLWPKIKVCWCWGAVISLWSWVYLLVLRAVGVLSSGSRCLLPVVRVGVVGVPLLFLAGICLGGMTMVIGSLCKRWVGGGGFTVIWSSIRGLSVLFNSPRSYAILILRNHLVDLGRAPWEKQRWW